MLCHVDPFELLAVVTDNGRRIYDSAEALKTMLDSKVGRKIASLSQKQLFAELINDAYKPKMHKIYSQFLKGAKVDFALNIRKSPFELQKIEKEVNYLLTDCLNCSEWDKVLEQAPVLLYGPSKAFCLWPTSYSTSSFHDKNTDAATCHKASNALKQKSLHTGPRPIQAVKPVNGRSSQDPTLDRQH